METINLPTRFSSKEENGKQGLVNDVKKVVKSLITFYALQKRKRRNSEPGGATTTYSEMEDPLSVSLEEKSPDLPCALPPNSAVMKRQTSEPALPVTAK